MKKMSKILALFFSVLAIGLGSLNGAKSQVASLPWCKYTGVSTDYCALGSVQVTHCTNSTAGGSCGISTEETLDPQP